MKYLNLGCGLRFHPEWVNIDGKAAHPAVSEYDLRLGIPHANNSFQVVYHSHVLEHFPRQEALRFMKECYRVVAPKGVIRVAVPDLERIAQLYLQTLGEALNGGNESEHRYEWMMLEMYDQVVRECSGGAMLEYLKRSPLSAEAFIHRRMGGEMVRVVGAIRNNSSQPSAMASRSPNPLERILRLSQTVRAALVKTLLGREACALLAVGRFRASGEIHRWMYDRYSLKLLMEKAGFKDTHSVGPTESRIPNWTSYNLDTEPEGAIYKPDSLYMEAIKD